MILFLTDTGCRSGELRSLKMQDVNLEKREAWLEGKTGGRWVDFIERTARAIQDWLEVRPEMDCPYLFPSQRGGQLTPSGVWQIFFQEAFSMLQYIRLTYNRCKYARWGRVKRPRKANKALNLGRVTWKGKSGR